MTLQSRIDQLLREESQYQNVSFEKVKQYAVRGCQIAFNKSLHDLIELYHFTDEDNDRIRDIIRVCIEGGKLDEKI